MRLLICAGGTGGGVYPALAVLQEAETDMEAVLWVGSQGGLEANLVQRANIPYKEIPAAGVHGISLFKLPGNFLQLARGYFAARTIIKTFKPDGIFLTGGYLAVPLALAAVRIPKILYVPDLEPGLALKVLMRLAKAIAVTVEDTKQYLPPSKPVEVTGYPIRPGLKRWSKSEAARHLGLDQQKSVLLVFGGSKGARSINLAVLQILEELLAFTQVIHISGSLDWEKANQKRGSLKTELKERYHLFEYLHEMGAALAAADLVVSRAGASVLGEFPLFGLPAILVPYPYAWQYQKQNADYLADRHAAVIMKNENLESELLPTIHSLLGSPNRLTAMSEAMRQLAKPEAARKIAEMITKYSRSPNQRTETPDD